MNFQIGLQTKKLIVNSTDFGREAVGLERIYDIYTSKTDDADFFQSTIKNGATQSQIQQYFASTPSNYVSNSGMLVEKCETKNLNGNITQYNVDYVGLCKDSSPRPIISLQPSEEYAFNPYVITIEFITSIGSPGSQEEVNFLKTYKKNSPFPKTINGVQTFSSPVAPFGGSMSKFAFIVKESPFFAYALEQYYSISAEKYKSINRFGNIILTEGTSTDKYSAPEQPSEPPTVQYNGLVIIGISYRRYGNYAHAIISGQDSAYYSYKDRASGRVIRKMLNIFI